jgi:predicted transcriptional regulator
MEHATAFTDRARHLLAELMAHENVSCNELSRRSGVADTTIGRFLKGGLVPTLDCYERMLAGLGVSPTLDLQPA